MLGALTEMFSGQVVIVLVLASLAGVVLGAIPGLGGIIGLVLLLPFVNDLGETATFVAIAALTASVATGDTIPSVLWGVPGTAGSQATVMDGHPLAKRGEAVRALSASYLSSTIGGIIGAAALFAVLPIAGLLVLAVGSPEMLLIAILGLSLIGVLSGRYPMAGLLLALVGLVIGMVGQDPQSGIYRWTFGQAFLIEGISVVPVALGLFAVPEMIDLVVKGQYLRGSAELKASKHEILPGYHDVWKNRSLVLRTSLLGTAVGIAPGIGSAMADWLAYGYTVRASKDRSQFGRGDIRGVIGPESANNSKTAGAFVPTLIFGVPGGLSMVFVLAAMIAFGLNPGPRIISERSDLVYLIIWAVVLSNVIAGAFCTSLLVHVSKVAKTPVRILVPLITVTIVVAALLTSGQLGDLIVFFFSGVLGWTIVRAGWSRPPIILAVVLGPIIHQRLQISNQAYGFDWIYRPGVLVLIGVLALTLLSGTWKNRKSRKSTVEARAVASADQGGDEPVEEEVSSTPLQVILSALLFIVFLLIIFTSLGWPESPKLYGLVVAIPGAVLAIACMIRGLRDLLIANGREWRTPPGDYSYLMWLGVAGVLAWILGPVLGLPLFAAGYMRRLGCRWRTSVVIGLLVWAGLAAAVTALQLTFPVPLIDSIR